ncbi:hypothetical protein [Streptomyces sp. NPDC088915]|uniref:hypothetical protein n=1 Tax=Streptomyces sp. NPDC088915 TaxID=3365912 RepID=UPI0037F8A39D
MSRAGWAVVGMLAVLSGVSGCQSQDSGREKEQAVKAAAAASPRAEDSGPLTRAKIRLLIDSVTADTGAPPNDPDRARTPADPEPGTLPACFVTYRGFGTAAPTLDVARTDAVANALIGRGWTERKKREERTAPDGTVDVVEATFKKRGWTLVMEYRLFGDNRTLTLDAFDDACVEKVRRAGNLVLPAPR